MTGKIPLAGEERRALAMACLAMGYRRMGGDEHGLKFGKPLGYTLLLVDFETCRMEQWFKDGLGKLSIWDSKQLAYEGDSERPISFPSFLAKIKDFEAWYVKKGLEVSRSAEFCFMSAEEQADLLFGGLMPPDLGKPDLWFYCGSCGAFGRCSDLLPDESPDPHPCGRDECPSCHAEGCVSCCLTDTEAKERGAVEGGYM